MTAQRDAAGAKALAESRARFEVIIEKGLDLVLLTDASLVVSYASPSSGPVLGYEPATWVGRRLDELVVAADNLAPPNLSVLANQSGTAQSDVRFLDHSGRERTIALTCRDLTGQPAVGALVWNGSDVTERRALEEELTQQAFTDVLTGLANRAHSMTGLAISSDELDNPEELVRAADLAMYQAKNTGRGRRAGYQRGMRNRARDDLALNADLDHALDRRELEVYYQPVVGLTSHTVVGAEALLRWHHPVRGPVSPLTFIPLAELSGQIVPIGRWVLGQACGQAVTGGPPWLRGP